MSSNTGAATSPAGSTSPTNTTARETSTSSRETSTSPSLTSSTTSSTSSTTSSTSSTSTTSSTTSSTSSTSSAAPSTSTFTSVFSTTVPASTVTTAPPTSSTSSIPSSTSSTSTTPAALSGSGDSSGGTTEGLSNGGKIAIAVVVPVVVIALLLLLGIFCFRKRKAKKSAEEERRNEIAEYGFNPNNDPTLPNIAPNGSVMAEDSSGYRGWGVTPTVMSNRKTSTTLSGGLAGAALSDSGSQAQYKDNVSPDLRASDAHSGDALMNTQHDLGGSTDEVGALGIAPAAGANQAIKRGPSNASSAYSNGARSDNSDGEHPMPGGAIGQAYDYNPGQQYGYSQHGPYGDGSYGGGQDSAMPVVRDVTARRNTRIQQGGQYQQGNSGIAQNF